MIDPHNDQLSVALIVQLVEHWTGIAEVRVQVLFRPEFFRSIFRCCLNGVAKLGRSLALKIKTVQLVVYIILFCVLMQFDAFVSM